MLLALDIGNTTIAYGFFYGSRLIKMGRVDQLEKLPTEVFKADEVRVASVVPKLDAKVKKLVFKRCGFYPKFITYRDIPMRIALKNKAEIGIDRLLDAYAARKQYGAPLVVVDFGTATTFCAVDKTGTYRGGAIAAGIGLTRHSLHEKTAKLPLVKILPARRAIGRSTVEAMRSGIFLGYIGLVNGLVGCIKRELEGRVKVVATGGYAKLIARGVKFDIIDPALTLKGIRLICLMNCTS